MKLNPDLYRKYAADPAAFRADLIVDVDGTPRRFGDVQDDWQRADFASLDPALKKCVGCSTDPALMRAYFERPRGHSKTTDIAVLCIWALAFATRPIRGYAFAADRDQADLLRAQIQTVVRLNPWLSEMVQVEARRVVNVFTYEGQDHPAKDGSLTIETSDIGSSYGILPDLIVADELTHWPANAEPLWHSILSSAAKRSACLLLTISNAGFQDSWQWNAREACRVNDHWIFSRLEGVQASWMTPERMAAVRKDFNGAPIAFARLYDNLWSPCGGDALSPTDIEAAFRSELLPMTKACPDYDYVCGVDLGLTRDCSAAVVLAVGKYDTHLRGQIRLAHAKLWKPIPGQKLNLMEIELYLVALDRQFGQLKKIALDAWQAELLAQRLDYHAKSRHRRNVEHHQARESGAWVATIAPTPSTLRAIASLTIESFADRRLRLYPYEPLRRDLLKLRVEERADNSFRLTSPRDGDGHGDTFSAFALALFVADELAKKKPIYCGVSIPGPGELIRKKDTLAELQANYDRIQKIQDYENWVAQLPDTKPELRQILWEMGSRRH